MKKQIFLVAISLYLWSPTIALADCVRVKEDEYRAMQEELLTQEPPVADVNAVMNQRTEFCSGKCGSDRDAATEGLCILKKVVKAKKKKKTPSK